MSGIKGMAIESLVWQDTKGNFHPRLAESWKIHPRPDGVSKAGLNEGGVAAIEFHLRKNVTFHDGSEFNASVVKWNYDRAIYISGYENYQWNNFYWMDPALYVDRFIPTWNLSWAINDPEISVIDTAAWASIPDGAYINYTSRIGVGEGETKDYYIWFDTTGDGSPDPAPPDRTAIYVNISAIAEISVSSTADNVTITNKIDGDVPNIADVNSGLAVSTLSEGIIRNPFKTINPEFIPIINSTIVVSKYVLNMTFNKWYVDLSLATLGIISQEAYGPWFNKSIPGYGDVPDAPDGTPFPGHMIGTGPYKFESVDFIVDAMAHSTKFENYWNRTALEAEGLFSVTDLYGRFYADDTAKGNALLALDIDLSTSMLQEAAPIADVKASPYLNYFPTTPDPSPNVISLLSAEAINTPLWILGGKTIREWFPYSDFCTKTLGLSPGTPYPEGINKTVRRALSYAYDYNGYLAATYPETSGGGMYCWSPWGMGSPYTNESAVSHPGPEPDLTKARTILLNDPYYNGLATARGLSLANTTDDWVSVA
ncbi:MAG: ABC transporter substrate-binding protein, partial [Promethearchaeota archaeon]